jgi:hypothetical protein
VPAIMATLNHLRPSVILRTVAHSVCGKAKAVGLFLKAAAASDMSRNQIRRASDRGFSAYAAAPPSTVFEFSFDWFQRCEPSELLLGEVSHAAIIAQGGVCRGLHV